VQSLYDAKLKDLFIHFMKTLSCHLKRTKQPPVSGTSLRLWGTRFTGALAEPVSLRCWKMDLALP
jgi:hypothetical protein